MRTPMLFRELPKKWWIDIYSVTRDIAIEKI
jgi:hypothetical protein